MKTWNIILRQSNNDTFDIKIPKTEKKLIIETNNKGNKHLISTNVFRVLKKYDLNPKDNANDLLNFALGVYTIDQVISRSKNGFQSWSRHFRLYVPVLDVKSWEESQKKLEKLLSFLSGDKWIITFRQLKIEKPKQLKLINDSNPKKIKNVSLFSGGIDSFVGAIDLLEEESKMVFISHYKRGSEGSVQKKLYKELRKHYGKDSFQSHQLYVQPNQRIKELSKEGSSRARSFLFMCLGITFANTLGDNVNFIIPENGLISLNVPLTGTRLSSHSTRTTHPYYLKLFKEVILILGMKSHITNPYQFKTKGEMMLECKNQFILKKLNSSTVSCSHPEQSRYKGKKPGIQCGYCVPCIIRQSAEKKSSIIGSDYVYSIIKNPPNWRNKSASDIRAFKLALNKFKNKDDKAIMFDILSSGPLPFKDEIELKEYTNVYIRGMNEVEEFLFE